MASICGPCLVPLAARARSKARIPGSSDPRHACKSHPSAPRPLCCCKATEEVSTSSASGFNESSGKQTRRQVAIQSALAASLLACGNPSLAETASPPAFTLFEEAEDKYSLLVPADWEKGEGKAGTRRVLAFYPPGISTTNVNVVVTILGGDFTGLGSFGTAYDFGENLVNGLDRSWKRPPGQAAKLLDTQSKNGFYYIEYTLEPVGKPKVHLLTVVGTAHNRWVNRLYTVTGQFLEDSSSTFREPVQKAIKSFKFTSEA